MDRKRTRLESELCTAVNNGEPRSVQLLLSQGARPDLVGRKGLAAIHLAVGKETEKNTRCLKMLLQHGADPNIRSSEGLTPLHIAALWGCYGNLKLLLMNGGNPNMKDNDGKTPRQLAEQQDNRKCAQLLQEHLASSADTEDDDLPQFQYSIYSDHTDTSSYPLSDYSFSSQSSMMSDFGEGPLSSTRRSSFFNLSNINGRPSCKGISHHRLSDVDADRRNLHWNTSVHWASEGRSLLSSTRMSAVPVIEEDDSCTDDGIVASKTNAHSVTADNRMSPPRRDTLPSFLSRRASRKSVSFCDVDEYFPVFSPESPQRQPAADGCSTLPFDLSEYSSFLDSERMATVLHKQGIDVTSPDHVYVFCRESSESTEEELEKTVMSHCALEDSDDEKEVVKEAQGKNPDQKSHPSGSSSSQYSSCDSDHYTSALDASVHPRSSVCVDSMKKTDSHVFIAQTEALIDVECDTFGKLSLSEGDGVPSEEVEAFNGPIASSKDDADEPVADVQSEDLPFTPSPFVTGRTRSRMSRCSLRESSTLEKLFTSSLFDETLPTPVRSQRQTPRPQRADDFYSSPQVPCYTQHRSGRSPQRDASSADGQDTQTSTVTAGTSLADTLILPQGASGSAASQSLCETVILEENQDSSADAYEKHLEEVMLAMQGLRKGPCEDGDFLTDGVTSTDEAPTEEHFKGACDVAKKDDAWISEDWSSQPDSVSSASSSSYVSPKRSRDDSDPPCTPGTGCTPRYSMSRLSSHSRPHQLANLSYTPGGRPHIPDVEEPVEYLYTDTEQGHELIETHVPPTANTSLSSREDSSEDTILYDWRVMHNGTKGGKENQKPQGERESESISGITDKDLRLRLVELGESPGPISRHTRPTYMKKLCRLLQESNSVSSQDQRQSEEPNPDSSFSPELNLALRTFKLPECQVDEQALCQQFDQPDQNRKWREGIVKSSFNYLLLDPRVTKNLPFRSQTMTPHECFQTFIRAVFYVGKGKRSRPYSHLYEALEYYRGDKTSKKLCRKVQHILQVWNAEQGVISLHCFQNVIPVEAYTREACMVEAIGLKMLTNQKRGDFYGVVSNWQLKRKRELGVHLLYRAMQIFLAEGERQLRPADIRQ